MKDKKGFITQARMREWLESNKVGFHLDVHVCAYRCAVTMFYYASYIAFIHLLTHIDIEHFVDFASTDSKFAGLSRVTSRVLRILRYDLRD
jgi:hypothetical protein